MFLESEKRLIKKNYRGYHGDSYTTYISNYLQTDQVVFCEEMTPNEKKVWSVSFPLKLSNMNYKCYFNDPKSAKIYIKNIVDKYI